MFDSIKEALIHTPIWVYILLIYLIRLGMRALRTRVVSLFRLMILPALLLSMSLHTLITAVQPNVFIISSFSLAMLVGICLGFWQVSRLKIEVDKQHYLVRTPGSPTTLIVILIIFVAKYYFGYELARDPDLINQTNFELSLLGVSGICSGLFIGRLVRYIVCFKIGNHVPLRSL